MHKFWYDYVKPKYGTKAKLCYMDTDSFIVYIKTNYIYKDIAEGVETMFCTSSYELNRPLLLHYKDHNKAKGKKSVPEKENLHLEIIKTV